MKKWMISAAVVLTAFSASASDGPVATKSRYENDRNLLGDPSTLNRSIEACSHLGIKPEAQRGLAKLMNVSEAKVRFEFCRRIYTAYANGAISYDDYVGLAAGGLVTPSILNALRNAGARPPQLEPQPPRHGDVVLPISAKMNTGETFKGFTIASRDGGHFSAQSSRHAVKCSGSYDPRDRRPTVTLPVECSDGRTGQAEITRTPDLMAGRGTVKLSDGSSGRLTVGTAGKRQ